MYAGHMAAGLALRGRARKVPVAAFLIGAFVLDLLWIAFGVLRIDHTPWDDWSHSLLMSVVWATAFAACFWTFGRKAFLALWLAVFSHFVLDLLVQGTSLYPNQPRSSLIPVVVATHVYFFQLMVSALLLLVFIWDEHRVGKLSWRTMSVCVLVLALNARFVLGV